MKTPKHTVRVRFGWGWKIVKLDEIQTMPIESAILAQQIAENLDNGMTWQQAVAAAGGYVDVDGQRVYKAK